MAKYCSNCGEKVDENAYVCTKCGYKVDNKERVVPDEAKSRLVAGLLGIFLGYFGIHNFYLGYNNKGVAQLLISILGFCIAIGPIISGIWGLIEGIMILTGKINTDASGMQLKD